ncbi:hypothetical protein LCGC14_1801490 [marine sediment metagenome]|uniref:Uncharacterized protein n=1 Tax=marine sediment metagenome TaxID=412755 RepID=A0A0F9GPI4_9ZZZZ
MKMIVDYDLWRQACKETPLRKHVQHDIMETAEEAAIIPGNCVKSVEREHEGIGFPKYHGVLVRYGDECVVRGHKSLINDEFVWVGTKEEYSSFWVVD